MTTSATKDKKHKINKLETQKFINKIRAIYVPIHGTLLFNTLFNNLNDYHLLNMIKMYKNELFLRHKLISNYIMKEKFITYKDISFVTGMYINAIQHYLHE